MLNLELRYRLSKDFNLTEFYDYGYITVNPNNNFAGAAALNNYGLKGVGLSLAWQSGSGSSIKTTYSHRLGDNPNLTVTGNDQDGSLSKNRVWLTMSFPLSVAGSGGSVSATTASSNVTE